MKKTINNNSKNIFKVNKCIRLTILTLQKIIIFILIIMIIVKIIFKMQKIIFKMELKCKKIVMIQILILK